MNEIKLNVEGMVCEGCEKRVVTALSQVEGICDVIANHTEGTVIVKANTEIVESEIKERIEDLGFEVKEG